MNAPNFKISDKGPVSRSFLNRNIPDFQEALLFVKRLLYKRNENKADLLTVFSDNCGTCSTKHALLKVLVDEQGFEDVKLILGVVKMNANNTPSVKGTLEEYELDYIPEAHNYLRYKGEIIDCTKINWKASELEKEILEEIEISPAQITDYKVSYHKTFLKKWLEENKNIPYTLEKLWEIREQVY